MLRLWIPVLRACRRALPGATVPAVRLLTVALLAGLLLVPVGAPAGASPGGPSPADPAPPHALTLFFVLNTPRDFFLVPVARPTDGVDLPGDAPERWARRALELLIQGPPEESVLSCPIPRTTRVLDARLEEGTLRVDFSPDLLRANVGSRGEALLLSSLVATAGQFPGIERVQILVEGRSVESLAGHVDLQGPVPVTGVLEHAFFRGFPDLAGHWSEGVATALHLTGVIHGRPSGEFAPADLVTRAEFFKMVVAGAGLQPEDTDRVTFADVPRGHWAHGYVERAVSAGIIVPSDYGARLGAGVPVRRREAAVALVRARGLEQEAVNLRGAPLPYTDTGAEPEWARGYLAVARREGLMVGMGDGTFRPRYQLSRAEAAAVTGRLARLGGPSVYVVYPRAGATVRDGVLVLGVARVFEGTVLVRLRAGDQVVARLFTTATEGAPGWGLFAALVPVPTGYDGEMILDVYTESAADGSEQDLVSVPVRAAGGR